CGRALPFDPHHPAPLEPQQAGHQRPLWPCTGRRTRHQPPAWRTALAAQPVRPACLFAQPASPLTPSLMSTPPAAPPPASQPAAQPAVDTLLTDWGRAMDRAMAREELDNAAWMAQIVLQRLPRHLPTYRRLLALAWTTKRWDEGEDWARRLLQADPGHAAAWQASAMAAEQRGQRDQAKAMWQRAFEMNPYGPEIRAGMARTSLDKPNALSLDAACLAM